VGSTCTRNNCVSGFCGAYLSGFVRLIPSRGDREGSEGTNVDFDLLGI
jgi:hypothetical protein